MRDQKLKREYEKEIRDLKKEINDLRKKVELIRNISGLKDCEISALKKKIERYEVEIKIWGEK